jgi:hypothetical protein
MDINEAPLDADLGFLEQWEEEAITDNEALEWLIANVYDKPEVLDAIK